MKNFKNLGQALNKAEQKMITGGKLLGPSGGVNPNDGPCFYSFYNGHGAIPQWTACNPQIHSNCCEE